MAMVEEDQSATEGDEQTHTNEREYSKRLKSCDSETEELEAKRKPSDAGQYDEEDEEIRQHSSYEQVMLDVNRCAGRLERMRTVYLHRRDDDEPPEDLTRELELQRLSEEAGEPVDDSDSIVSGESDKSTNKREEIRDSSITEDLHNQRRLKAKLAKLIVKLLIKKPGLHYYQGFHDVCLTYMTLLGDEKAFTRLDHLVDSHFKTFMQPTMNETQDFLALIPVIIGLHDYKIQEFLNKAEVGTIFSLSWVITWFSHVIQDENDVETIFRFLEGEDPHMVLYLCASIVIYKKSELIELEPEMSTVHHYLCQIPRKEKLPLDDLISKAQNSFTRWSPEVVKQKLDNQRRTKLRLYDYNLLNTLANQFGITIPSQVTSGAKTAVVVLIIASVIALQFDRWTR